MSALSEFVPRENDETVRVIATHGDCLAVGLMVDAKREQSHDLTAITRLQGLEPVPQEFHHRRVMLQVGLQFFAGFAFFSLSCKRFFSVRTNR